MGTMAGKLKGVMPATTPNGCISDQLSIPGPASRECSPLSNSAMPQAYSTTSIPRCNSPAASLNTLPCSLLMMRQISSACCSSNSRKRNMMRARRAGGVAAQPGNAALAAEMASFTVAESAIATRLAGAPSAGSKMSWLPPLPAHSRPAMKCPVRGNAPFPGAGPKACARCGSADFIQTFPKGIDQGGDLFRSRYKRRRQLDRVPSPADIKTFFQAFQA